MFAKSLICILLLTAISAKFYSIDVDMNIQEISEEVAELFKHEPRVLGISKFIDNLNKTGWIYFAHETNSAQPDWLQTYAAGYSEGYLTYNYIYSAWSNEKVNLQEKGVNAVPKNVTDFLQKQLLWISEMVLTNRDDPYWNLVNATVSQLLGMYDGFVVGCTAQRKPEYVIPFIEFYQLTYLADLGDVVSKLTTLDIVRPSCSFLLKMTEDDLFSSHVTWGDYVHLLRVYKVFNLNLKNPLLNTKRMSFSGHPGAIASIDDFYMVDNNRVVTETSISGNNDQVYGFIQEKSLPYWLRANVANLVFTDQKSWADTFYKYRSGTYNNQWIIIDYNNYNAFKNNLSEAKDIIWFVEEFYSLTSAQDVTQQLLIPQGYVASYNVPYDTAIQNLSQDPTNYTTDPRYTLFKKYAPGIKTFKDFQNVMRMNNVSDTRNYCEAISSRCDLQKSQTVPWGAYDCKVTSDKWIQDQQAWIISGPTIQVALPSFKWTDWPNFYQRISGLPTYYNFEWVFVSPDQNFTVSIPLEKAFEMQSLLW